MMQYLCDSEPLYVWKMHLSQIIVEHIQHLKERTSWTRVRILSEVQKFYSFIVKVVQIFLSNLSF